MADTDTPEQPGIDPGEAEAGRILPLPPATPAPPQRNPHRSRWAATCPKCGRTTNWRRWNCWDCKRGSVRAWFYKEGKEKRVELGCDTCDILTLRSFECSACGTPITEKEIRPTWF